MTRPEARSAVSELMVVCLLLSAVCFPRPVTGAVKGTPSRAELRLSRASLTVDGVLDDKIWQETKPVTLVPSEPGVPEKLGGRVQIVMRGGYLCLGAFCPEPGGKVQAMSVGFQPVWAKDASSSPDLEDRLLFRIRFNTADRAGAELALEIDPWGGFRVERDGKPVEKTAALTAAAINTEGWNVEAAVPLDELAPGLADPGIGISVTRIRPLRPQAPEFRWKLPGPEFTEFTLPRQRDIKQDISAPRFNPPLLGNSQPPLQIGRVQALPPVDSGWDDPFWRSVPGFELPRNEPFPRRPEHPTEVKWAHDGKTLALYFRCTEDERVDCDNGARDGGVGSDDHVRICLATSGSSLIEVLVNPAGAVSDSRGRGPHMFGASSGWNGNIQTHYLIQRDYWTVRINLPLDEVAAGLGEQGVPENWRVLLGRTRQPRDGEPGEMSTLPVIGNPFLYSPMRWRRAVLTDLSPAQVGTPEPEYRRPRLAGLAGELLELDSYALPRVQRKYFEVTDILSRKIGQTVTKLAMEEHQEWDTVQTLGDWEKFRDKRIEALKAGLGEFPSTRPPLLYQVGGTYQGDGYQVKNIAYQSRPGFFVAANLYLPSEPTSKMPGIIIIPSHHYPRTQGELKDCGIVWARCGCAVLIIDNFGYGERVETLPWYRQAYQSEYLFEQQLTLIGQSRLGWEAWDMIRGVDLFYELGNIDRDRIILIGSVTWGGGRPAAIAGLFEKRLACLIPFNFGRVYWENYEIRNSMAAKITPWFICCAGAPRKFIYAHEFSWEGDEGPAHPSVWVPAWPRYEKVYELYGARDNLATSQGQGLLRVRETAGDCYSLGSVQRKPLYPILKKWLNIPEPSEEDRNIELDTSLGFTRLRADYEAIKVKEARRRMPDSALISITPEVSSRIERKPLHRIASESGTELLAAARKQRSGLDPASARRLLAEKLSRVLGDVEPNRQPETEALWSKTLTGARAEALMLKPEPGIIVPLLIIKPEAAGARPLPVVVALAEGGKDRFLKDRAGEIESLIKNGIAVCLPDVRGTGETAPGQFNRGDGLTTMEFQLAKTTLGDRLKDVRTVLAYLESRSDLDRGKVALWGDSFAPVNPGNIWVDELAGQPVSPQIQHFASPLGAHLALLAALFHDEIRTVAVRGGLVGYLSVLDENFNYVPPDMTVPGILEVGDIQDICACLAPRPLLVESFVDGKNRAVGDPRLRKEMETATAAYAKAGRQADLILRKEAVKPELAAWLIDRLNK